MIPALLWLLLLRGVAAAGDVGRFVDETTCASCHPAETQAWRGSDHDRAMQEVSPATVLGDFNDVPFEYAGTTTLFRRRAEKYVVATDGPDGKRAEFEVAWLFGVDPLQQLLLPLPGGRLQALSIAWDTRSRRWFHLFPDERVDHRDVLHWTRPSQNWNFRCAECHSTNVDKNYDVTTGTYATRWFRIDVGCQACHGPGGDHVDWARERERTPNSGVGGSAASRRLAVELRPGPADRQVEACARCHSRRSVLAPEYRHGQPLMDSHLPATLDEGLYHVDGQVRDEVFEYGSFLQSRMFAAGLRCSDCHDPHSGRTKAPGDALCVSCHNEAGAAAGGHIDTRGLKKKRYDSPAHHFHEQGKPGSACVDCHAPRTVFMGVDARADHSFRLPRPDLSVELGVPNPCQACHAKKDATWAAHEIAKRRASDAPLPPHFATALAAGRRGKPGALQGLFRLAEDVRTAPIVRATALREIVRYPGPSMVGALQRGLSDEDPLVRHAAVSGIAATAPPARRAGLLAAQLADPVRGVRIEAARVLLPSGVAGIDDHYRPAWNRAVKELEASHRTNIDSVEGRCGLGDLEATRARTALAEEHYRAALALDPASPLPAVNLAELLRARGDDEGARTMFLEATKRAPRSATAALALSLSLVRQGRKAEALARMAEARKLDPSRGDIAYVLAAALADSGDSDGAVRTLEAFLSESGYHRDVVLALLGFHQMRGDEQGVVRTLSKLRAANPEDPALPR